MRDSAGAFSAPVCAVIVSFNPDGPTLQALIASLRAQHAQVVVVDNASAADVAAWTGAQATLLRNASNLGLGTGFNQGIAWARAHGAAHVILFDQDSLPGPDMLARLLAGAARLRALGIAVAAVGPRFVDVKSGRLNPVNGPERFYMRRKMAPDTAGCCEAGYLISSGKLIALEALEAVGTMREDLFIDAIDIEWCLRARMRGWRSYAVDDARMRHDIGERVVQVGGAVRALHGPLRHYYIIRNALLLMRSPEVPWQWKVSDAFKTVRRLVAYPLLSAQPWQHVKWMGRGLRDGLLGRSGPAPQRTKL